MHYLPYVISGISFLLSGFFSYLAMKRKLDIEEALKFYPSKEDLRMYVTIEKFLEHQRQQDKDIRDELGKRLEYLTAKMDDIYSILVDRS